MKLFALGRFFSIAIVLMCVLSVPLHAQGVAAARHDFKAGNYEQAITNLEALETAQSAQTAEALTLHSEIISAQIMLGYADNSYDSAQGARALAYRAVQIEPDNVEAYIQYALAFGLEARTSSVFKALRKKLPENCKVVIERAQEMAPEDARPLALLGAWHLGVVHKAGKRRALKMYDASTEQGMIWYDAALKVNPNDIVVLANYAFSLLGVEQELYGDYAEALMRRAQKLEPEDATQIEMKRRIDIALGALGDPEALKRHIDIFIDI